MVSIILSSRSFMFCFESFSLMFIVSRGLYISDILLHIFVFFTFSRSLLKWYLFISILFSQSLDEKNTGEFPCLRSHSVANTFVCLFVSSIANARLPLSPVIEV